MRFEFLGDRYALLDTPGSPGFAADGAWALPAADLALVVVDPDPERAALAEPALRQLEARGVPTSSSSTGSTRRAAPSSCARDAPADERFAAGRAPDPDPRRREDHRLR